MQSLKPLGINSDGSAGNSHSHWGGFPFPPIPIPNSVLFPFPWDSRSHWESHSHAHLYLAPTISKTLVCITQYTISNDWKICVGDNLPIAAHCQQNWSLIVITTRSTFHFKPTFREQLANKNGAYLTPLLGLQGLKRFQLQVLCPPPWPLTRGSASGLRWGLCLQTPIVGSRCALPMDSSMPHHVWQRFCRP